MSETGVNALSYYIVMHNVITQCGDQATGKRIKELWFISQWGKKLVSSPQHPTWLCKQPSLPSSADQRLFLPWVKRLGSVVLKNGWSYTSTPIYVYGVHRHNSYLISRNIQAVCAECKRRHKLFQAHRMKRQTALT